MPWIVSIEEYIKIKNFFSEIDHKFSNDTIPSGDFIELNELANFYNDVPFLRINAIKSRHNPTDLQSTKDIAAELKQYFNSSSAFADHSLIFFGELNVIRDFAASSGDVEF